jgi:hypothetical protein
LLEAGGIFAEALLKARLPIPAARHAPEVIRRAAEEKDRKKNVIPKPHPAFASKQKLRLSQMAERLPKVRIRQARDGNSNEGVRRQSGL